MIDGPGFQSHLFFSIRNSIRKVVGFNYQKDHFDPGLGDPGSLGSSWDRHDSWNFQWMFELAFRETTQNLGLFKQLLGNPFNITQNLTF